jgi:hypothetical protein
MLFRGIYNLLSGFSEILTLADDDRQSIAYLCEQQKHLALLTSQPLDGVFYQNARQVATNRHY